MFQADSLPAEPQVFSLYCSENKKKMLLLPKLYNNQKMKEMGDSSIPNGKKQAFTKLFQISNSSNSRLLSYFLTPLLEGDVAIILILRSVNSLLTIAFMFSLEMSA